MYMYVLLHTMMIRMMMMMIIIIIRTYHGDAEDESEDGDDGECDGNR